MSISWGNKARFKFVSGGSLLSWEPPALAAIYAITYRPDPERPKSHSILFVGQADNLAEEAGPLNEEVMDAWKSSSNDVRELYVFIHPMPGSTTGERFKVQEQLVAEYGPRCNR